MTGISYLDIILSSSIVYIFVIVGIRVMGKNELSQLSISDLVFILLISNSVQNAMVGEDTTLLGGIIAATTLFLINKLFNLMHYRSDKFAEWMDGKPIVLIRHGKLNKQGIRESRMTHRELEQAMREQGVGDMATVDLAILEIDGKISILSDKDIRKGSKLDVDDEAFL